MPGTTVCLPAYPLLRLSFRVLPVTVFLTSGEHAMSTLLCFSFVFGYNASYTRCLVHAYKLGFSSLGYFKLRLFETWNFRPFVEYEKIFWKVVQLMYRAIRHEGNWFRRNAYFLENFYRMLYFFLLWVSFNFAGRKNSAERKTKHANITITWAFAILFILQRDAFQKWLCFLSNESTCLPPCYRI